MDYQTKPTSRRDIRKYAKIMRQLFDVPEYGPFPVLDALEKLPDVFPGCNYVIVEDKKLAPKTMAQCIQNDDGTYTIEIKETVYVGAFEKEVGAFRGFICHELCHVFMLSIGFTPIFTRSFAENELPAYCSTEWQAMALAGEVMVPFGDSIDLTVDAIIDKYQVSRAFAEKRKKLGGGSKYARKNKTH